MVVVSADARRAYVTNIGSGTTTAIDLVDGRKLEDIATGAGRCLWGSWSRRDGRSAYVAATNGLHAGGVAASTASARSSSCAALDVGWRRADGLGSTPGDSARPVLPRLHAAGESAVGPLRRSKFKL